MPNVELCRVLCSKFPGSAVATQDTSPESRSDIAPSDRLDSWKEIAAYFNRDARTVQRWEKTEDLPVRRHVHSKAGTVYAYPAELDAWWNKRGQRLAAELHGQPVPAPAQAIWRRPVWPIAALLLISLGLFWAFTGPGILGRLFHRTGIGHAARVPGRLLANVTAEGRSVGQIRVGRYPYATAVTPDGSELYVSNEHDGTVSVIRTSTGRVAKTVNVGGLPRAMAISPDGRHVYVANGGANLDVIDTSSKAVTKVPTGAPVTSLALTLGGRKAYLTLGFQGLREMLLPGYQTTTLATAAAPMYVAVTPDGSRLYVNYQSGGPGGRPGHDAIDILDTATDRVAGNIAGPPNVGGAMAVSPDGSQVWANGSDACRAPAYDHAGCPAVPAGIVHVIRTSDNRVLHTLAFPNATVSSVSFFPDGSRAVVATDRAVEVIDTSTFATIEEMNLKGMENLAFTPDGRMAYAAFAAAGSVAVFDLSAPGCTPPPAGLVAWWTGDGTGRDIRSGTNGTLSGAAGFAPGMVGQAFQLDGASAIHIGPLNYSVGPSEFTIAAWVKLHAAAKPSTPMTILDKTQLHGGAASGWRLFKDAGDHIVFCVGSDITPGHCHTNITATSRTAIARDVWIHLAATRTSQKIMLYVDGAFEASAGSGEIAAPNMDEVRIGSTAQGNDFLNGLVDEVQWFNRALSASEIKSIFSARGSGLCYGAPRGVD